MPQPGVPFSLSRKESQVNATAGVQYVAVERRVLGVARLDDERLVLQLAESRAVTEVTDVGYRQRIEADPVAERAVPLDLLGDARLRRRWLAWELVLTAIDLRAFEGVPGAAGVELRLRVERRHRDQADELVSALRLALADLALRQAEHGRHLAR